MNIIADIILAAIILIAFIVGYKKGFVQSIWKIAALVITIVLVIALKNPAINFLSGTNMADSINTKISQTVHLPQGGGVNIAENLNLPEFMREQVEGAIESAGNAINNMNDAVSLSLTGICITIITCIALFIIIRLLLMAARMIIEGVTKAPVIKGTNRFLGGLLAVVNAIFLVFLLLALVSLFAPADSGMFAVIEHSYVVKYLYNYNILLQLFMKI